MRVIQFCMVLIVTLATSIEAKEYVVGVEQLDYLPQYGVNDDNQYDGIGIELLRQFDRESDDVSFRFIALPIKRLHMNLLLGAVDFKYPDSPSWNEVAKTSYHVTYSDKLVPYVDGVIVRSANVNAKRLEGLSIGLPLGFTEVALKAKDFHQSFDITRRTNLNELIELALKDRVDGIYLNIDIVNHQLKKRGMEGVLVLDDSLPYVKDHYQLSTVSYPDVIDALNEFVKSKPRLVVDIMQRYGVSVVE